MKKDGNIPMVRISGLFPITLEDMDKLTNLQQQLPTSSELWDALDEVLKSMSDKYCDLKKQGLVK